ncbi:hypothetical protein, partial [Flavobacterium noncentrifugens]
VRLNRNFSNARNVNCNFTEPKSFITKIENPGMKKIHLLFALFLLCSNTYSQTDLNIPRKFPTENGTFTFPLGSKILIEIKETSKGKYDYRVLSVEPIKEYYSLEKEENLFSDDPKQNTIELFMGAYYNEGKDDKDWKTVLVLRNNTKEALNYKADIKYYYSDKFENTSIAGTFPKVKSTEIWANKIDYITLYGFENLKTN